nr:membrane-associated phosphatidylinositol transfer protein 2 isoform X1 [Ciona intestinalis]|eukprot:XP_026694786.1 membrane-associated phosphatidylinositol transfer protein 2 isoform X1 [Ciona intestinalis]
MLIKEYKIPMPLSVQEYRIAQLYMIQKKSREESQGTESGVEIIQNKPYSDGPGGDGQYTQKIYHISKHIPGWLVAILPKDALIVEEEAWNAYPYTRTRYTCPFIEKFSIDIETRYFDDTGEQENVFDLPNSGLRSRSVDEIDIVNEQSSDYKKEEDPRHYVSKATGRGPLSDDWITNAKKCPPEKRGNFMCAYKQCKVEFKYWGMQSKIEKFIHDTGLRKVMLRAHKQAWCWQDEWYGLTIDDIRKLEKETQLALQLKFGTNPDMEDTENTLTDGENKVQNNEDNISSNSVTLRNTTRRKVLHKQSSNISSHSVQSNRLDVPNNMQEIEGIRRYSSDISSDEEEFFDAQDEIMNEESFRSLSTCRWGSSIENLAEASTGDSPRSLLRDNSLDHEILGETSYSPSPCKVSVLLLVLHGGNGLEASNQGLHSSKQSDVHTLQSTLEVVMKSHYKSALGHLAVRLVSCPVICNEAYHLLQSLNPSSHDNNISNKHTISSSLLSLFGTSTPRYKEIIRLLSCSCNFVYNNFILSQEGKGFNGQVCIISDTIGSVLAYDLLCNFAATEATSRRGSSLSYHEEEDDHSYIAMSGPPSSPSLRVSGPQKWDIPQSNPIMLNRRGSALPSLGGDSKTLDTFAACAKTNMLMTPTASLTYRRMSDNNCLDNQSPLSYQRSVSHLGNSLPRQSPPRQASEPIEPQITGQTKLEFEVSDFFMLGSPLGLVLAMRQFSETHDNKISMANTNVLRPNCRHVYNLFYSADPSSARIEPLLDSRFSQHSPANVSKYHLFPLGDGQSNTLSDILLTSPEFMGSIDTGRRSSEWSIGSASLDPQLSGNLAKRHAVHDSSFIIDDDAVFKLEPLKDGNNKVANHWWGDKRVDFSLFCPEVLSGFPSASLPYLFHSSFWESLDVAAFLLRQIFQYDNSHYQMNNKTEIQFSQTFPTEKWLRKRTNVKLRNLTANHRCRDSVALENTPQVLVGRFMYGPLDMVTLTGEKIDIYILTPPPSSEWVYMDTEICTGHGKVTYTIPDSKSLTQGLYPVKMIVRGDHTSADSNLAVLPQNTECVIFSIDGSFTASVSIMGSDPKVRPGAVDVVRLWQDLGYLIIYVTGRPDMQKHRVVTWLSQHNFPHGMVWFGDGISKDPLKQKTILLKNLKADNKLIYAAGYGSSKDIAVYSQLGIEPDRIFIVGKVSKKQANQSTWLNGGYSVHLDKLSVGGLKPGKVNAQMLLKNDCFGLPGQPINKRSHSMKRRTGTR